MNRYQPVRRLLRPVARVVDRTLDRLRRALDERADRQYATAPFCAAPLAPSSEYRRLWADAQHRLYPTIDRYEDECGSAIDPGWFHGLALLTQVTIKRSEICYQHGRVLYATLVRYARGRGRDPLNIIETGTARGFSALCLGRALHDAGATGKILSFDVLPHDVRILWNCVLDADGPRTRAELLDAYRDLIERFVIFHRGDTKSEMARMWVPRVHFAFLDSVHTYEHVMAEFSCIRDRQRPGDVLVFDDYSPKSYPGVVQAADEICRAHGYRARILAANPQRQYVVAEKA
jgi:predicted O-methyltransferase YrrM